jgi:hypothetical protein
METWYVVEYSYIKPNSDKIKYKGRKECDTIEEVEKFVAVVYFLSKTKKEFYDSQQNKLSKKYLGKIGKFVGLNKVYKYMKKEIQVKDNK